MILLFFLAEKGLLKEFEDNLKHEYYMDGTEWSYLYSSFCWADTVQGYHFWSSINKEYQEFLRSRE